MRARMAHALYALLAWLTPVLARAADQPAGGADKLHGFGLAESGATAPAFGRVIVAFVLVAALAWGVAWLLRRYGFRGAAVAGGAATPVRHLARSTLPGGIACHVVEAQGRQVLITVTRHGVTSLVLGDTTPPVAPGPAP
jgi:hypothetical protein